MMQNTHHQTMEDKLADQAGHYEHPAEDAFNRRNSLPDGSRRNSLTKNFDHAAMAMAVNDKTHVEIADEGVSPENDIDNIAISWFVWLVAFTASIAGALFGYDTGIISAVLVYLGTDLGGAEVTASEKEAITSLCSAGAFIGAIIAGLTADKVNIHSRPCRLCAITNGPFFSTDAKSPSTSAVCFSSSELFCRPVPTRLLRCASVV